MTSPYAFTDQAIKAVLDILTPVDDAHDAHLDAAPVPATLPASAPPLAADIPPGAFVFGDYSRSPSAAPSYALSLYASTPGGYAPLIEGGGSNYVDASVGGGYAPLIMPGTPGARPPVAPGAPAVAGVAKPYVFPAQQPKPGENRILRELQGHQAQDAAAKNEMKRREEKLAKDRAVVRYLDDKKREKYRVTIGQQITRAGAPFDTAKTKLPYLAKSGSCLEDYITAEQRYEWGLNALIWVCVGDAKGTEKPSFFSHVGKIGRFHHSSFNRGGGVIGAGEWIIKDGALLKVSANSGHYQPTIDFLYHAVLQMAVAFRDQASGSGTTVFLFDKVALQWIDYPVKEFIKAPTMGGRLASNPKG